MEQLPYVLTGARVVTPGGVLDPGWVSIDDGRITGVGAGADPGGVDLSGQWLLPGFIDLHVHGGGGHDATTSYDAMAASVAFHRGHGTTRTLVSLMAQPVDLLCEQLTWIASLAREGVIAGAHLEGPFLATKRCGAQNPVNLLTPDPVVARKLLEAGDGWVRTMTLAPELPDALPLITELGTAGITVALGHTDATYAQARAGFDAGASLATHLFNAMGTFTQREPGPSIAALDAGVTVELINDGVHVHDGLVRVISSHFSSQVAFITDAISATGVGDGTYTLGDRDVVVEDGRAHLAGSDRIAGSTLTQDLALRRAVSVLGLPMEVASMAVSGTPARVLGLSAQCGAIATGLAADLVILDEALKVQRVMVAGTWC
jgi:N-acetylglucosamine-6-phosphate deacetylase